MAADQKHKTKKKHVTKHFVQIINIRVSLSTPSVCLSSSLFVPQERCFIGIRNNKQTVERGGWEMEGLGCEGNSEAAMGVQRPVLHVKALIDGCVQRPGA